MKDEIIECPGDGCEGCEGCISDDDTNVEAEQAEQEEPIIFERADFNLKCSCGHNTILQSNVENGALQYVIPTTNKHKLELQCPACLNKLTLYWTENTEDIVEENIESNEQVSQINKEEE